MTSRLPVFCASLLQGCVLFLISFAVGAEQGVPVSVASVQQQGIYRQVAITGSVTSPRVASLSPATSGLVTDMHAEEGDRVDAGTVVLALDDELAQLQWRSARAAVEQARSALDDSRRRLEEARRLGPQRGIAETEVRSLEAEVALDKAALDQADADAAYRKAVLERHQLKAPFAGVVSRKQTEQGEWVDPGQGVLELVATDNLRLDFAVAEDYLSQVRSDTAVQFRIDAVPDTTHEGRVKAVVPVTDPGARTFLLRVVPAQSDLRMIPGMSVSATLSIDTGREGLVVPRDAILRQPNGRIVVWTVESGDSGPVASENPVKIGQTFDGKVEILEGIASDARVVVRGNEALQNGQPLRITGGDQ